MKSRLSFIVNGMFPLHLTWPKMLRMAGLSKNWPSLFWIGAMASR
jgi:hypothetical protein